MKSTASIDYVDVSSGRDAGDDVDNVAPPTPSPLTQDDAATPIMVSADIHAVMLGLWASGLRCVIVYALIATLACLCAAAALLTPAGS